jgi:prepilin-type processing-associated H-X9-DG protein
MIPIWIALTLASSGPQAQEPVGLRDLLYRDGIPAKVKDLGPGWTIVSVIRARPPKPGGGVLAALGSLAGDASGRSVVFTRGEMVRAGSRSLLVGYGLSQPATDFAALFKRMEGGDPANQPSTAAEVFDMIAPPPTPESALLLELFDLSDVVSIEPMGLLDPAHIPRDAAQMSGLAINAAVLFPVFAHARAKARAASSTSNLKQIGLGILMYAQDWDEKLPPMGTLQQLKKATYPYIKNDEVFRSPIPGVVYVPNERASKVVEASVDSPSDFVLVYESKPEPNGTRGVLFGDGHVKRVRETEWAAMWERGRSPYRAGKRPR